MFNREDMHQIEFRAVAVEYEQPVTFQDKFEYQPEMGWSWLQRLCIRFLRWRKCYSQFTHTRHTTRVIKQEQFLKAVQEQMLSLARLDEYGANVILIGVEDFNKLMCDDREFFDVISFSAKYDVGRAARGGPIYEVYGLRVIVSPWMRGFAVLPSSVVSEIKGAPDAR